MIRHHLQRMSQRLGLDRLRGEGWSVTYLTLMAALILMSYGLARGPSEALFLKELSHTLLPGLWIEVGIGVVCVVAVYNYLLRFFSLKTMFSLSVIVTFLSLIGIIYGGWGGESRIIEIAGINFPLGNLALLRLWCDLYIVVFVETYWSMANRRFSLKKATYIYGLLCAGGTIGSVMSNSWVAARTHLPEDYILYSLYTLPALFVLNVLLHRHWGKNPNERTKETSSTSASKSSSLGEGIRLIFKSRYLIWILALVLLAQITVALIDYEYKRALRDWYLVQPERAYLTDLYSRIDWQMDWQTRWHINQLIDICLS